MKITFAQQPAVAGAITANQTLLGEAAGKALAEGSEVLLAGAQPLAGDAADLHTDPGFARHLHAATTQMVREHDPLVFSCAPEAATLTTRDGVKVAFATLTDPGALTTVANAAAATGAHLLAISAALPYTLGGPTARLTELGAAAGRLGLAIAFCNRVGGADRAVYDGGSLLFDATGRLAYQGPLFTPDLATFTVHADGQVTATSLTGWPGTEEQVYTALVTGTRDYVRNNGFTNVVIGLSGGIDSALVAAIAVDALGAEQVHGIGMPGPFSSEGSLTDARSLAENLGIRFDVRSITETYTAEVTSLGVLQDGPGAQVAQENMQARIRALHLFTIANAANALVLNTCNKSEDAVGYATIGGDAMGAYAPLADAPKTLVYRLARWRNTVRPVIPTESITKAPSAELAPGQQDTDTLPPYDVLDTIVHRYLTCRDTPQAIIEVLTDDFSLTVAQARTYVAWVLAMMDRTEWKRQQGPLGPQITAVPFAARQVPVTNGRLHQID